MKSTTMTQIVVTMAGFLLLAVGVLIAQAGRVDAALFVAVSAACVIMISLLLLLPGLTASRSVAAIEQLSKLLGEHVAATGKQGSNIDALIQQVNDLRTYMTIGTLDRSSWFHFASCVEALQKKVEASQYVPDIVVSIGRSGAIVGGMLAGNMGELRHIAIDRINEWPQDRSGKTGIRKVIIVPQAGAVAGLLRGMKLLVVMSECDTGKTFEAAEAQLKDVIEGIAEWRTAVLFRSHNSNYIPHYIVEVDSGKRPEFPFRGPGWRRTSKSPKAEA